MSGPLVAIADDSPEIVELMSEILDDAGYRIVACDPSDGVETLFVHVHPDLLILDIRLPGGVTGLPLIHAIRENPATANLPLLVTAADMTFLRENAGALTSLGCETLAKPFDIDSLLGCVGSMLPRQPFDAMPVALPCMKGIGSLYPKPWCESLLGRWRRLVPVASRNGMLPR